MSVLEKLALGVGGLFMLLGVLRLARSPLKLVFRVAVCCGRQTLRGFCYIGGKSVVFGNILR